MSGGSYDYLCFAEPRDIFGKRENLQQMVDALAAMGYTDAAKETETIALILNHFEARMGARLDRLTPIWKAVEWYHSGDTGPHGVAEAIADYRKEVEASALPQAHQQVDK